MSNTNFDFVVDVAKLVTLGLDLSEAAETITSYNEMIETKIADLGTCWSGTDYDALVASFEKYKSSLAVLPALFTAYSSKVGDYDKAVEILENLISTIGEDHKYYNLVLFHLTTANRRRGTLDKAQECLEKLKSA